jgi:phenylacetate 2-hydroxylase
MVSAGLDTVPANVIQGLAYLATPHGQDLQDIAFRELIEAYGTPAEAWTAILKEEKVSFITALVKETLRYYTVIAMSLPRESIKPIKYQGATIPAGTLFYMNARSADFDSARFDDPYTFNPDRYLHDKSVSPDKTWPDCPDWRKSRNSAATLCVRCWVSNVCRLTPSEPRALRRIFQDDPRLQAFTRI